jgi:hypothetical protein
MSKVLAAAFAAAVLISAAAPAAAAPVVHAETLILGTRGATAGTTSNTYVNPCSDSAYQLIGAKWAETLQWYFRARSTPSGLSRSGVAGVIKQAFANVTGARNDCGLPDRVSAAASYKGTTARRPSCSSYDGYNVVGFKSLSSDKLAITCYWTLNGKIVDADILINNNVSWSLSLATCTKRSMLEATLTHEVGHAFGLDHVSEAGHGRLTMSPVLDGLCNNNESTLGQGDVLGLEKLY